MGSKHFEFWYGANKKQRKAKEGKAAMLESRCIDELLQRVGDLEADEYFGISRN